MIVGNTTDFTIKPNPFLFTSLDFSFSKLSVRHLNNTCYCHLVFLFLDALVLNAPATECFSLSTFDAYE